MGLARPAIARMLGAFVALVLAVAIGVPLAYWHRVPPWSLAGFSMTLCPCASPCPCRSGGRPTHPDCEAATFVHVVRGHYGAVRLDGHIRHSQAQSMRMACRIDRKILLPVRLHCEME